MDSTNICCKFCRSLNDLNQCLPHIVNMIDEDNIITRDGKFNENCTLLSGDLEKFSKDETSVIPSHSSSESTELKTLSNMNDIMLKNNIVIICNDCFKNGDLYKKYVKNPICQLCNNSITDMSHRAYKVSGIGHDSIYCSTPERYCSNCFYNCVLPYTLKYNENYEHIARLEKMRDTSKYYKSEVPNIHNRYEEYKQNKTWCLDDPQDPYPSQNYLAYSIVLYRSFQTLLEENKKLMEENKKLRT